MTYDKACKCHYILFSPFQQKDSVNLLLTKLLQLQRKSQYNTVLCKFSWIREESSPVTKLLGMICKSVDTWH